MPLFRQTYHLLDQPVILCDQDNHVIAMNSAAERLTGWREEQACNISIKRILRDYPCRQMLAKETSYRCQCRLTTHPEHIQIPVVIHALPASDRAPAGFVLFLDAPVTNPAPEPQTKPHRPVNPANNIFEHLSLGFWSFDIPTGTLTMASQACANLLGISPAELRQDPLRWKTLLHPEDAKRVIRMERQVLKGSSVQEDFRITPPDGSTHWLRAHIIPVLDPAGRLLRLDGLAVDISDLRKAESALVEATTQAEAVVEQKSVFLAGLSQDLQSPLLSIGSLAELLVRMDLPESSLPIAEEIHHLTQNLLTVANDLQSLAKLTTGKLALDYHPFSLASLAHATIPYQKNTVTAKGIRLQITSDIPEEVVILGDFSRLRQVIICLTHYVLHYCHSPALQFQWRYTPTDHTEGRLQLTFSAKPPLGHRANRTSTFSVGTSSTLAMPALDLSISQHLLRLMRGTLTITDNQTYGLSLEFTLPLTVVSSHRSPAAAVSPTVSLARRILIIDDTPSSLQALSIFLHHHGHVVDISSTGRDGLEKLVERPYDLVFIDCHLPDMDALAAARMIRSLDQQTKPKTPLILLTSLDSPLFRIPFAAAGINDFLCRPIQPHCLRELLQRWLPEKANHP